MRWEGWLPLVYVPTYPRTTRSRLELGSFLTDAASRPLVLACPDQNQNLTCTCTSKHPCCASFRLALAGGRACLHHWPADERSAPITAITRLRTDKGGPSPLRSRLSSKTEVSGMRLIRCCLPCFAHTIVQTPGAVRRRCFGLASSPAIYTSSQPASIL